MSGLTYRQKSSKASKYAATVQNDFRGEDRALVDLLIKEAFIAGLDAHILANEDKQSEDSCHIDSVSGSALDFVKEIPRLQQSQASLKYQLMILRVAANKLGLYDAADFIKRD
jgi:hypothetical protein